MQFVEFAKLHRAKTEGSYMREHSMVRRGRKGGREGERESREGEGGRREGGREWDVVRVSIPCCLQTMLCHRALEAVTPLVADCSVVAVCGPVAVKEYCQLLLMRY